MSKKRVHEIAKEQGMSPKVALARMQAAGMKVGAASSSVDEETALRALGNGGAQATEAGDVRSPAPNGGAQAADAARLGAGAKAPAAAKTSPRARANDGSKRASASQ
ncbi:MAG: translation initiation factor IF-2 N-terminal domain-containing protein, partial [Actinomycetota bacterium]|nr:translation initiation factor IF-2 N-terminal domain-containing protein [Actinomycetota bacterium]